jgi:Fe-S-cluster-containing dehydrogenase component
MQNNSRKIKRITMMKPYKLIVDQEACWGCKTCVVACKQENRTPHGSNLISVMENGAHTSPESKDFVFQVTVCRHCDDPPCREACPEEAIVKRSDGIVVLYQEKCVGCKLCVNTCPFGAIGFDEKGGTAHKCNLCHERVDRGLIPACADNVCLAHCILFSNSEEM